MGGLMEIFQNRQQHEVVAKTSREETTSSSKRGIMYEMLERPAGLAMKKTAENTRHDQKKHRQPEPQERECKMDEGFKFFSEIKFRRTV